MQPLSGFYLERTSVSAVIPLLRQETSLGVVAVETATVSYEQACTDLQ
jgi:hypothetical protein